MKKVLFAIVFMIIAGFTMNAQVANTNSDFIFHGGKFYQNGTVIAPEQLPSIFGQQVYDNQYKPAKGLRTAGITCLSIGGAATAIGGGLIIGGIVGGNSSAGSAAGGTIAVGTGIITAACGAAVAITGGILLGTANKRMKNLRPASNGAGLALAF